MMRCCGMIKMSMSERSRTHSKMGSQNTLGRLAKYSTYKQHLMHIPHALVVAQGELYLLFNCYARFPLYWADELNAKSSPMI
mmetsp:Transcript_29745/g.101129  ORF Transcript_29745/g.101129 Transcript_29745/m.101129 type:complete len:82 (-) Transcript_29745:125-370(-)